MPIRIGNNPVRKFYAGPVTPSTPADIYIAAVISAGGTLSGAQETAISTFYSDLVTAGIYSKLHAMWPFLGGVAASNALDFINPGGSYDLTFNGSWTHTSNGAYAIDSSGNYIDTGLNPSTLNSTTNFSFGQMIAGAQASNGYSGLGPTSAQYMLLGQASNQLDTWNGASAGGLVGNGYIGGALHINSRTDANTWTRNYIESGSAGTNNASTFSNTLTSYNANLYFNEINGVSGSTLSGQYRFCYAGEGLNGTEIQDFADAINTLQTAFSRNLW